VTDPGYRLIEQIHAAPQQAVIVVTGGGASAISALLAVPGGSRTLLEAIVPYSEPALADWLGGRRPEQFCVEETALAMAAVAFQRACQLQAAGESASSLVDHRPAVGVACTASLVSDRPKKGDHRCHVATQTRNATTAWSLVLEKGARNRDGEERLVGNLILHALARAAGLDDLSPIDLRPGETIVGNDARAKPLLVELLEGKRGVVWSLPGAKTVARAATHVRGGYAPAAADTVAADFPFALLASLPFPHSPPAGLLCGAFHPVHFGHRQLRDVAERLLGGPVYYEISIRNVDKPPLDFLSIERRRAQFADVPLALTAAPTFAEKAVVLPGVTFVVGVDTAERIVQPRYYGDREAARDAALREVRGAGCRFLVAGRQAGDTFLTLADVPVPDEFSDLFTAISAETFRADVSSTELRRVCQAFEPDTRANPAVESH
jgi:nicotinamide mononucleotide (NMN) deamidase PncC